MRQTVSRSSDPQRSRGAKLNSAPCSNCKAKHTRCVMESGRSPCLACKGAGRTDSCVTPEKTFEFNFRILTQEGMKKSQDEETMKLESDDLHHPPGNGTEVLNDISMSSAYATYATDMNCTSNKHLTQGFDNDYKLTYNTTPILEHLISMSPEPMSNSRQLDPSLAYQDYTSPLAPNFFEIRIRTENDIIKYKLRVLKLNTELFVMPEQYITEPVGPSLKIWLSTFTGDYCWIEVDESYIEIVERYLGPGSGYMVMT